VLSVDLEACSGLAASLRTLLGPKSAEKLLLSLPKPVITNDGATVLSYMRLEHPAAKLMVQLSQTIDQEFGDGTTSVVVLAAAL
jgi:chaperonin GroEL (HSP60 family)